jgi:hypothetical protein
MALRSTQPLKEMSTRCISWGKGGRCAMLTTLPPSCAFVTKSGNLNFLEPSGPLQACNGTALPLHTYLSSYFTQSQTIANDYTAKPNVVKCGESKELQSKYKNTEWCHSRCGLVRFLKYPKGLLQLRMSRATCL